MDALTGPLRWPHVFPTLRRLGQEPDGRPPGAFDADLEELADLARRFYGAWPLSRLPASRRLA